MKTFAPVLEGDGVASPPPAFAKGDDLAASRFTATGVFEPVILSFFERGRKDYKRIPINERVEVLSLVGHIALGERGRRRRSERRSANRTGRRAAVTYWRLTSGTHWK